MLLQFYCNVNVHIEPGDSSRVSVATDFYSNLEFLTKRCKDRNVKSHYKKMDTNLHQVDFC